MCDGESGCWNAHSPRLCGTLCFILALCKYSCCEKLFPLQVWCCPLTGVYACPAESSVCVCVVQIDYMWEQLRQEFVAMDPYHTTFVNADEFRDVLSELCVHLSKFELESLVKKFDIKGDGRWASQPFTLWNVKVFLTNLTKFWYTVLSLWKAN